MSFTSVYEKLMERLFDQPKLRMQVYSTDTRKSEEKIYRLRLMVS